MKITVGIPSRGRPLDLAAAVLSLHRTISFGHEVNFIVGADADDDITIVTTEELAKRVPVGISIAERGIGLGEIHNRLESATPKDSLFLLGSDRIVPCLEHWDHALAMTAMQFPSRVIWMDSIHLVGAGQFSLTPQWRKAAPCPACPGYFPFWFEDTWVEEVDHYVHGSQRVASYAKFAGPRVGKTSRMRDLPFWIDFYQWCQPIRIAEARQIAENLGVVPIDTDPMRTWFDNRMNDMKARTKELTEQFSGGGDPEPSYIKAKKNAEDIMNGKSHGRPV